MEFRARDTEVGSILHLEHVNFTVPGQDLITIFFINGLGLTRDPYKRTDETNFGVNVGQQQFHLPTGGPTPPFPGLVHLVSPDLPMIVTRLRRLEQAGKFDGTPFSLEQTADALDIVTPFGPKLRIVSPADKVFHKPLGIYQVDLLIPQGTADGCAAYYSGVLGAPAEVQIVAGRRSAVVVMGPNQRVIFSESEPSGFDFDYRSFHLAFYISHYNQTAAKIEAGGGIKGKAGASQMFSTKVFDPRTGETLFLLENEVRSVYHPDFMRPLINRWPLVNEPFTDQFRSRIELQDAVGFRPGAAVPVSAG
jgi:hypothetical protein